MNIIPRENRIVVKQLKIENKTKSGILIPDTASKERPMIAEVLEVGSGEKVKDLKKGDKIVYAKYAGVEIKHENEEYLILNNDDILGIIKN